MLGQIFSSEEQAELVAFVLSGRGLCLSECEERMRIPLGKSSYDNICNAELCKGFLRGKTGGIFSNVTKAEVLPIGNCALHHSIYVVFPNFVHWIRVGTIAVDGYIFCNNNSLWNIISGLNLYL